MHTVFRMPMHSKEHLGIQYLYKEAILSFSPNNLYFVLFFETRSHVCQAGLKLYTQDGLKLVTLPPQPPKCWGYRCPFPVPVYVMLEN